MTCELVAPKIVYGNGLTNIIFNLPLENREIQESLVIFELDPVGTVTTSSGGKTETIVNFIEKNLTLEFNLLDLTLRDALQTMYDTWAVFGNTFFFFPDKTKPEFFALELDQKNRKFISIAVGTKWSVAINTRSINVPAPEAIVGTEVIEVNGQSGPIVLLDGNDILHASTLFTLSQAIVLETLNIISIADNATIATPIIIDFNSIAGISAAPSTVGIIIDTSSGGGGGAAENGSGTAATAAGDVIILDSADNPIITVRGGEGGLSDSEDTPSEPGAVPVPTQFNQPLLVQDISFSAGVEGGSAGRVSTGSFKTFTGQTGEPGNQQIINLILNPDKIIKLIIPEGGAGAIEPNGENGATGRLGSIRITKIFTIA